MTVSPPGHECYFEQFTLVDAMTELIAATDAGGGPLDAEVIGELLARFDTDHLSALTTKV